VDEEEVLETEVSDEAVEGGGADIQPEGEGPVRALLGLWTADDEEQPEAIEDTTPEEFADAEQPDGMAAGQLAGDEVETVVRRKTVALVTAVYSTSQCQGPAGHARQAARTMLPVWMRFEK
jgi:hypothetical protein